VPYAVFPHGMLDPYFKRRFPAKHAKKWLYWLLAEYWVLRGAKRALFTTEVERDLAAQSFWLHRWAPMVTALGTEPPPADTDKLLAAFYERCPDLVGKRFLLFLGRIDPKKGCDLLINAFSQAAQLDPNSDLQLVMAGPSQPNYKNDLVTQGLLIGDISGVHWPGILLGDAKWGALAACEAFVLTSHQENFGIAVVEALASGKPVLISDQINIAPDIAADGCGLVEPDTLEGATRLLERWQALTPPEREAMSQRARATFATRYDMRRNTAAILNVFAKVSSSKEDA
jgi:glycosyltransferase involved in cell wall biosynthesis